MRALAEILLDRGWRLSGSDLNSPGPSIQRLIDRGLAFHLGHDASNIPGSTGVVVFSPAIPPQNTERAAAAALQIPQFSYSQMVGHLMSKALGVSIAGTHGKSTVTAMTATILTAASRLSGVVLGAEVRDTGRSGWSGSGDLFVAESCEFQGSFLDYFPKYTALLSVEPDHFDCYADVESLTAAFTRFAGQTAETGVLLFNADSPLSVSVSANAPTTARRVSFGLTASADWQAMSVEHSTAGVQFMLHHRGQNVIPITLPLPGQHNIWNSLAAAALCTEIGVDPEVIARSLSSFHGIRRRFEKVEERNGITLFDDYAHHPTAVKVTLEALRKVVGSRKIFCVFQPHQVLRTKVLMADFASSFGAADHVIIAPIFAAREAVSEEPLEVSRELARQIHQQGVSARFLPSLDQIVTTLDDAARPGDVIVTMGAGDIDRIHHEFTRSVQ